MKNKIIQITAGRGPEECCWVVAQVQKCFLEEAKNAGLKCEILHRVKGAEPGTLRSTTISISAKEMTGFLTMWLGTVQWKGNSPFRPNHQRKNWFIGVFELELLQTQAINEKDIAFQTMRSSGAGGQHVNKVSSAVRAVHKPTGASVVVMDSRSQHQNKKLAIQRLKEKVEEVQLERVKNNMQKEWENHLNLQRGNPTRVFKGKMFQPKKEKGSYKKQRLQLKNDLRNWSNE